MPLTTPLTAPLVGAYQAYQSGNTAELKQHVGTVTGVGGVLAGAGLGGVPALASAAVHAFGLGKTMLASKVGSGVAAGVTTSVLNKYGPGTPKDTKSKLERKGPNMVQSAADVLKHLSAPTRARWDTKYLGKAPRKGRRRKLRNRLPYSKNTATHEKMSHFHRAPAATPPSDITSRRAMREYLEQEHDHLPVPPPRRPVRYAEGVFPFDEGILGGDSTERVRELVPHDSKTSLHKRQYLPYVSGQDKTRRWIQGMLGPGLRKHLGGTDEAITDTLRASDRRDFSTLFGGTNQFHEVSIAQVNDRNLQRDLKEHLRDALARPTEHVPRAHALAGPGPHHMLKDAARDQARIEAHVSHVAPPASSTNEAIPAHA